MRRSPAFASALSIPIAPLPAGSIRTAAPRPRARPPVCAADVVDNDRDGVDARLTAAESARLAATERARLADLGYRTAVRRRLAARIARRQNGAAEDDAEHEVPAGDLVESIGGAQLDAAVAGPAAGRAPRAAGGPAVQAALDGLSAGVELFQRGCYREAHVAFTDAIRIAGAPSRLGGQIGLWQAQAVYAMGGSDARKDASDMLNALEKHADGEVRKAAVELKFILTAPVLPMDPGTFVEIPQFDTPHYDGPRFVLAASGVGRMVTRKPTKPEKYSFLITYSHRVFSATIPDCCVEWAAGMVSREGAPDTLRHI